MLSSSLLLLLTLLCSSCHSAGARAPAGSPDERDPGSQELLAQQDSGLPEELSFLLLQLHVPDPVLSKGGPRLDYPPSISVPCRMHARAEEHKLKKEAEEKCSIPFSCRWQSRACWLLGLQTAEKMREETGGGLDRPAAFYLMFHLSELKCVSDLQVMRQVMVNHHGGSHLI